jgi:predicted DNA-binding transcriptional regulator YafY
MENINEVRDLVDFNDAWYASATKEEQQNFRDWLLGVLRMHSPVEISFAKKDGTLREMKCTLKEDTVPKVENPKTSDTLCTVWDTELNQWRSFKFENIKSINFTF